VIMSDLLIDNRYVLKEKINKGAYAIVFKVYDTIKKKSYAMKIVITFFLKPYSNKREN
jgi:serine/threonine protein kinase